METRLSLLNKENILDYIEQYNHCRHERETLSEILLAIEKDDYQTLDWFAQFGDCLRAILLNSYGYRKALNFGFTSLLLDKYGWYQHPKFLELEELHFGLKDKERYGTYSTITLGRGINHIWAFGLSVSFGTAGSSNGISVYSPQFNSRENALEYAMQKLKSMLLPKVGDHDTTNYNQKVIHATLNEIADYEVRKVQLSLF